MNGCGDMNLNTDIQQQEYLFRCVSPEVTYPYPLYKDPAMEKIKLAHMKQNQVKCNKRLEVANSKTIGSKNVVTIKQEDG